MFIYYQSHVDDGDVCVREPRSNIVTLATEGGAGGDGNKLTLEKTFVDKGHIGKCHVSPKHVPGSAL